MELLLTIILMLAAAMVAGGADVPSGLPPPVRLLAAPTKVRMYRDAPSDATYGAEEREGQPCLTISYRLAPTAAWGSWLSFVFLDAPEAPLDLSRHDRLVLEIKVGKASAEPTLLRVTLYDVLNDQLEWHYQDLPGLLVREGDWQTLRLPLRDFRPSPAEWQGPRNDGALDLEHIGKVEVSLVTTRAAESTGTILIRDVRIEAPERPAVPPPQAAGQTAAAPRRCPWGPPPGVLLRGAGYSPFRRQPGYEDPPSAAQRQMIADDFAKISAVGFNAIRTWALPPDWVLALAAERRLMVLAGLGAPNQGDFGDPQFVAAAEAMVRTAVRRAMVHDNVIGYLVLNEAVPQAVLAAGTTAFDEYAARLLRIVHETDPKRPASLAGWVKSLRPEPPSGADVAAWNAYGWDSAKRGLGYAGYLDWLRQGSRLPLIVTEFGYSVSPEGEGAYGYGRNTLAEQATGLVRDWEVVASGGLGGCIFEYADENWKAGNLDVKDADPEEWFGLFETTPEAPDARPRPAVQALAEAFQLTVVEPTDMARLRRGERLQLLANSWPAVTHVEYRLNYGAWADLPRTTGDWCSLDLDTTAMADPELAIDFRSLGPEGTRQHRCRHVWLYEEVPPEPLDLTLNLYYLVEEGNAKARLRAVVRDGQAVGVPGQPVVVVLEPLAGWETRRRHGITDDRGVYEIDYPVGEHDYGDWLRAFASTVYRRGNLEKTYWAAVPFTKTDHIPAPDGAR